MLKLILVALIAATVASAQMTGGFRPTETTAEIMELAQWTASSLSTTQKHTVLAVKNAQVQVVAGLNFKFTLELLVDNEVTKSCEISIFKSLSGNKQFNAEPRCSATRAGQFQPAEIDSHVQELASWSASQLSTATDNHAVVSIDQVEKQIVNGVNYRFRLTLSVNGQESKQCVVSVYEQSWTGIRKFFAEPRCSATRAAVGGFVDSEVSEKVKEIAAWSAAALSAIDDHKVVAISNVKTQVVAGINYQFTLQLLVNGKVSKTCELSVHDQAWSGIRRFLEAPRCFATAGRALAGGFTASEVTPKVEELAKWFSAQLSSSAVEHKVVEISNVQTQVVNGINYRFTIKMTVAGQPTKVCEVGIFDKAWANERYHFEFPRCTVA